MDKESRFIYIIQDGEVFEIFFFGVFQNELMWKMVNIFVFNDVLICLN